jgi:hypothetical protein
MDLRAANLELISMFVIDEAACVRYHARLYLEGRPAQSLADWAAQEKAKDEAAKVVSFADMRARLRPPAAAER